MKRYVVHLPDVDVHFHGQEFFDEIHELSNGTDEEGRPLFVSNDFTEAMEIVQRARAVCRKHGADTEFHIEIVPRESKGVHNTTR